MLSKVVSNSGDAGSGKSLKHTLRTGSAFFRTAFKDITEHQGFADIVMPELDSVCTVSWYRIKFVKSDQTSCIIMIDVYLDIRAFFCY